jgi:transcriptional regulator with XRE-family HTH domain
MRNTPEGKLGGRATSAIDRQIGAKIRLRRVELGLSQSDLSDRIGVTFQQIQKYEKGSNRVSASMLLAICDALDISIGELFPSTSSPRSTALADSGDMVTLRVLFSQLTPTSKRLVISIVRAILREERTQAPG